MVTTLYTIGVPPPLVLDRDPWLQAEAAKVHRQLLADLDWTGFYRSLPAERLPPGWKAEGASPSAVQRELWQTAGAWRVLQVSLRPLEDPRTYRLRLRLVPVEGEEAIDLAQGEIVIRPGARRHAIARWVNALVEYDTGKAGVVGSRILLAIRTKPGIKEIAVVEADGQELTMVTRNGSLNLSPAWGPGGRVGYMSYLRDNVDWVVDGRPFSSRPGLNAAGAWSPDGRFLAISLASAANSDLYLLDGRTGAPVRRLTHDQGADTSPTWSPDGTRIAFVSDRTRTPQVWITEAKGGKAWRVSRGGYVTSPDWSPSGETLVYTIMTGSNSFAIFRRDLDTGVTRRVSPLGLSAESPQLSPDGRYIVFAGRQAEAPQALWIMDADGARVRPLLMSRYALYTPAWR